VAGAAGGRGAESTSSATGYSSASTSSCSPTPISRPWRNGSRAPPITACGRRSTTATSSGSSPAGSDPNDASRFAIPYKLDGRDGVIEGRIKDDAIELRPRDGEWKFDHGEVLRLNAPPATQPTIFPPEAVSD
jgi:hypothetical protein